MSWDSARPEASEYFEELQAVRNLRIAKPHVEASGSGPETPTRGCSTGKEKRIAWQELGGRQAAGRPPAQAFYSSRKNALLSGSA